MFFLVNCGQEETKEFVETITWSGLSLEVTIKTKYFDKKINYMIDIEDINKVPIRETDYYERLKKGKVLIQFMDKDYFEIFTHEIKINDFSGTVLDGKEIGLVIQKSREIDKLLYSKINKVVLGTKIISN